MKKRPTTTARPIARPLRDHELRQVRGGDGPGGNPGAPATDGGIGQMQQMMDQMNAP